MPHTKRNKTVMKTTLGELTAAYYEAALSELKNPDLARRVAEQMVKDALLRLQR
jgi:hypothetical protein